MGDYVYAFSAGGATVHRTTDLHVMVELELPGNEPIEYNYVFEESDRVEEDSEEPSKGTETQPCNESDSEGCED